MITIKITYDGKSLFYGIYDYSTFNIDEKDECFIGKDKNNGYTIPVTYTDGSYMLVINGNTSILFKLEMNKWKFINYRIQ